MKHTLVTLFIALAATSCNSVTNSNEKIKASIKEVVSRGMDKNKFQTIDSITINKIDTLTEKSALYLQVTRINDDVNFLKVQLQSDKTEIERNLHSAAGEKQIGFSDTFSRNLVKHYTDQYIEDSTNLANKSKSLDSLNKLYGSADGVKQSGYRAEYTVYFTYNQENQKKSKIAFLDNNYKIADTSNPILKEIRFDEELKKKYHQ